MAGGVVTRPGAARPRVKRLQIGDGRVASGIGAAGPWVDPDQDGTSREATSFRRRIAAAGQRFPEREDRETKIVSYSNDYWNWKKKKKKLGNFEKMRIGGTGYDGMLKEGTI